MTTNSKFPSIWINRWSKIFILFIFISISCNDKKYDTVPEEEDLAMTSQDSIDRGEYLVNTIGCHDCHSPKTMTERGPQDIPELALSGHQRGAELPPVNQEAIASGWMLMSGDLTAAVGPWGISYAGNLTSDDTGIGNWTQKQFFKAMREGRLKGQDSGRMMLPPMPWQNFAKLSDEDLECMFKYLKSTDPVENNVPAPVPPDKIASIYESE